MDKLQRLHQKDMSVEEYWQKMISYIERARINEDNCTVPYPDVDKVKVKVSVKVKVNIRRHLGEATPSAGITKARRRQEEASPR